MIFVRSLTVLITFMVVAPSFAQTDAEDATKARTLYNKGMANFQLEEYDAAIGKWEEGFRIKPVPEFLYNIAQAYRLSHRTDKALAFYQKYLRVSPKATNRDEVERHMAALEKIQGAEQRASTARPTDPIAPRGTDPASNNVDLSAGQPAVSSTTAPAAVAPTQVALIVTPSPERPIYKKGWFWGVLGGAVVVVAVAVVVGVTVGGGRAGDSAHSFAPLHF